MLVHFSSDISLCFLGSMFMKNYQMIKLLKKKFGFNMEIFEEKIFISFSLFCNRELISYLWKDSGLNYYVVIAKYLLFINYIFKHYFCANVRFVLKFYLPLIFLNLPICSCLFNYQGYFTFFSILSGFVCIWKCIFTTSFLA